MPKEGELIFGITYLQEVERGYQNKRYGKFVCYCGKEFTTKIYSIVKGITKSCGCRKGEWNRRLTDNQICVIRQMVWKEGRTLREIAEKFNVCIGTIWHIKNDRTYKSVA